MKTRDHIFAMLKSDVPTAVLKQLEETQLQCYTVDWKGDGDRSASMHPFPFLEDSLDKEVSTFYKEIEAAMPDCDYLLIWLDE